MSNSSDGIGALDARAEFHVLKIEPKTVDSKNLELASKQIYTYYGLSEAILTGNYTEEKYSAFYNSTIEPIREFILPNYNYFNLERVLVSPFNLAMVLISMYCSFSEFSFMVQTVWLLKKKIGTLLPSFLPFSYQNVTPMLMLQIYTKNWMFKALLLRLSASDPNYQNVCYFF